MRQRFRRKELHAALRDAPRIAQAVGQDVQLPVRPEAMHQSFFAVDHMLRPGVSLFGQQGREHAALRRHRVHGVLHHRELARGHCAQCAVPARRNAYRVLNLLPGQPQSTARDEWRHKSRQRCVMPAAFPNPGERRFAESAFRIRVPARSRRSVPCRPISSARTPPSRPGKCRTDATGPASSKCRCSPCSGSSARWPARPTPHPPACPCR